MTKEEILKYQLLADKELLYAMNHLREGCLDGFKNALSDFLDTINLSNFSKRSNIPLSTLNRIKKDSSKINNLTLCKIINTHKEIIKSENDFLPEYLQKMLKEELSYSPFNNIKIGSTVEKEGKTYIVSIDLKNRKGALYRSGFWLTGEEELFKDLNVIRGPEERHYSDRIVVE